MKRYAEYLVFLYFKIYSNRGLVVTLKDVSTVSRGRERGREGREKEREREGEGRERERERQKNKEDRDAHHAIKPQYQCNIIYRDA